MPINVDDGDHLQQGDDDEPDGAGERVEHLEPVLAGARREDQAHEETESADTACVRQTENNIEIALLSKSSWLKCNCKS